MKLIFVNRFFYPDQSATSQLLTDLSFALAARGYSVSIITSRRLYQGAGPAFEDAELKARERVAGVDVYRLHTSSFASRNLLGRAIDFASFFIGAAWKLWRLARRGDVVIAKTDPPMLSLLAVPIARWRRARAVNWLQDIYPEVAERLGFGGGLLGLAFACLRPLRNRSLRAADANVVLGERMADCLAGLGVDRNQIAVIPNWSDGRSVVPVAPVDNELRRLWGLHDRFVVGYSGNLGRAHEIETIEAAIDLVAHRGPASARICWLFVGGGSLLEALKGRLASRSTTPVCFKAYQPRERLAESLSAADVHLISLRADLEGLIVPSKFYGIAAAGRPSIFIGDTQGEIAQTLARFACGMSVAQGDGAALAEAVLALAADPQRCSQMGAAARQAFEANFDKSIAIARWCGLLGEPTPPPR